METQKNGNGRGLTAVLDGSRQEAVILAGEAIPSMIKILHNVPREYHEEIISSVTRLLAISAGETQEKKVGEWGL